MSVDAAENSSKQLTPKLTPKSTPTAYSEYNQSSALGNEQDDSQENSDSDNSFDSGVLDSESRQLSTVGMGETAMGRGGIEPPTHGFSVRCSTG